MSSVSKTIKISIDDEMYLRTHPDINLSAKVRELLKQLREGAVNGASNNIESLTD